MTTPSSNPSRRGFLKTTSTAGIAAGISTAGINFWATAGTVAAESKSANDKIQVACVGVGGKGTSDVKNASRFGKIMALCDTDSKPLEGAARLHRVDADSLFADYREMFDKMGDKIDAVVISTPDHTHAVVAAAALKARKHVYCQKPLTKTIYEARRLGELANEAGVATQMGNQYTAFNAMRKVAAEVKAGRLGNIQEVHVWTNRPVWPQGERRPMMKQPPAEVDWKLWLGPAPYRAYGDGYHPFKWRGWWDFGTGALGDMACHTCNMPFMALNMRDPTAVEAETAPHDGDSYPAWSRITFDFPELDGRQAFKMFWYDGGQKPDAALFEEIKAQSKPNEDGSLDLAGAAPSDSGALLIGDQGKMYAPGDYCENGTVVVGGQDVGKVEYRRSRGHEREWFDAMRDPSTPPVSNFPNYGGPLTETILLGNLAVWKRGRVEWDAKNMVPLNDPALERIVRTPYHNGYEEI